MDIVEKNLKIIEDCIKNNQYEEVETERFELKNLSNGWGNDFQKTVCAFLNTNGGIIVIGIQDKNNSNPKSYKFTGYDNSQSNESYLKDTLPKLFKTKENIVFDVSSKLDFKLVDFLENKVMVVYVESLTDEQKYVFYEGNAYRRVITGDHILSNAEIEAYEELKKEFIQSREIEKVKNTTLEAINIDTLNQYILRFNKGKSKGETIKADLNSAMSFLTRQSFVKDGQPTLLGMLICGENIESYIQGKCEADCYVLSDTKVAQAKEVINDNIVGLIDRTYNFVWRNIQIGVGYSGGGRAEPEYPEELIRESINNAFAHRNYNSDRFIIVEIKPNAYLSIRNPGGFERRQRIMFDSVIKVRRIIPVQIARNPKLTHILKSFDYWEGKGRGLSSLIDTCLENKIDVPYYVLSQDEIKLVIPKGKVYDAEMEMFFSSYKGYISEKNGREFSEDELVLMSYFLKSEKLNRVEEYTILLTNDNNHKNIIADLEEKGMIFKDPKSPEIYPIYLVDRVFIQDIHFYDELKNIYGDGEWSMLGSDYVDVLNAIYVHNKFGGRDMVVSASSIGTYLYSKLYKNINLNEFENFKRKIRNIFNRLEDKKFITRKDGKTKSDKGKPDFEINVNFQKNNSLLNHQK